VNRPNPRNRGPLLITDSGRGVQYGSLKSPHSILVTQKTSVWLHQSLRLVPPQGLSHIQEPNVDLPLLLLKWMRELPSRAWDVLGRTPAAKRVCEYQISTEPFHNFLYNLDINITWKSAGRRVDLFTMHWSGREFLYVPFYKLVILKKKKKKLKLKKIIKN